VAQILIAEGVDPSIIEIDYFGKEKPLTEAPEGVPEPRNRRVEITVR
jgi:outer membrane protein OmpA-like peptidoglycan-associated protein